MDKFSSDPAGYIRHMEDFMRMVGDWTYRSNPWGRERGADFTRDILTDPEDRAAWRIQGGRPDAFFYDVNRVPNETSGMVDPATGRTWEASFPLSPITGEGEPSPFGVTSLIGHPPDRFTPRGFPTARWDPASDYPVSVYYPEGPTPLPSFQNGEPSPGVLDEFLHRTGKQGWPEGVPPPPPPPPPSKSRGNQFPNPRRAVNKPKGIPRTAYPNQGEWLRSVINEYVDDWDALSKQIKERNLATGDFAKGSWYEQPKNTPQIGDYSGAANPPEGVLGGGTGVIDDASEMRYTPPPREGPDVSGLLNGTPYGSMVVMNGGLMPKSYLLERAQREWQYVNPRDTPMEAIRGKPPGGFLNELLGYRVPRPVTPGSNLDPLETLAQIRQASWTNMPNNAGLPPLRFAPGDVPLHRANPTRRLVEPPPGLPPPPGYELATRPSGELMTGPVPPSRFASPWAGVRQAGYSGLAGLQRALASGSLDSLANRAIMSLAPVQFAYDLATNPEVRRRSGIQALMDTAGDWGAMPPIRPSEWGLR